MNDCKHESLQFGSGDYYIFCHECGRKWCMMSNFIPEYTLGPVGKSIAGADPSNCVPGFSDGRPRKA
jgi:hypothetical protein